MQRTQSTGVNNGGTAGASNHANQPIDPLIDAVCDDNSSQLLPPSAVLASALRSAALAGMAAHLADASVAGSVRIKDLAADVSNAAALKAPFSSPLDSLYASDSEDEDSEMEGVSCLKLHSFLSDAVRHDVTVGTGHQAAAAGDVSLEARLVAETTRYLCSMRSSLRRCAAVATKSMRSPDAATPGSAAERDLRRSVRHVHGLSKTLADTTARTGAMLRARATTAATASASLEAIPRFSETSVAATALLQAAEVAIVSGDSTELLRTAAAVGRGAGPLPAPEEGSAILAALRDDLLDCLGTVNVSFVESTGGEAPVQQLHLSLSSLRGAADTSTKAADTLPTAAIHKELRVLAATLGSGRLSHTALEASSSSGGNVDAVFVIAGLYERTAGDPGSATASSSAASAAVTSELSTDQPLQLCDLVLAVYAVAPLKEEVESSSTALSTPLHVRSIKSSFPSWLTGGGDAADRRLGINDLSVHAMCMHGGVLAVFVAPTCSAVASAYLGLVHSMLWQQGGGGHGFPLPLITLSAVPPKKDGRLSAVSAATVARRPAFNPGPGEHLVGGAASAADRRCWLDLAASEVLIPAVAGRSGSAVWMAPMGPICTDALAEGIVIGFEVCTAAGGNDLMEVAFSLVEVTSDHRSDAPSPKINSNCINCSFALQRIGISHVHMKRNADSCRALLLCAGEPISGCPPGDSPVALSGSGCSCDASSVVSGSGPGMQWVSAPRAPSGAPVPLVSLHQTRNTVVAVGLGGGAFVVERPEISGAGSCWQPLTISSAPNTFSRPCLRNISVATVDPKTLLSHSKASDSPLYRVRIIGIRIGAPSSAAAKTTAAEPLLQLPSFVATVLPDALDPYRGVFSLMGATVTAEAAVDVRVVHGGLVATEGLHSPCPTTRCERATLGESFLPDELLDVCGEPMYVAVAEIREQALHCSHVKVSKASRVIGSPPISVICYGDGSSGPLLLDAPSGCSQPFHLVRLSTAAQSVSATAANTQTAAASVAPQSVETLDSDTEEAHYTASAGGVSCIDAAVMLEAMGDDGGAEGGEEVERLRVLLRAGEDRKRARISARTAAAAPPPSSAPVGSAPAFSAPTTSRIRLRQPVERLREAVTQSEAFSGVVVPVPTIAVAATVRRSIPAALKWLGLALPRWAAAAAPVKAAAAGARISESFMKVVAGAAGSAGSGLAAGNGGLRASFLSGPATLALNCEPLTGGRWYWEVSMLDTRGGYCVGIMGNRGCNLRDRTRGGVGELGDSWGFAGPSDDTAAVRHNSESRLFGSRVGEGTTLCVAVDVDAGILCFGRDGEWIRGGKFGVAFTSLGNDFAACSGVRPAISGNAGTTVSFFCGDAQSPLKFNPPPGYRPVWEAFPVAAFSTPKPPVAALSLPVEDSNNRLSVPEELITPAPTGYIPVAVHRGLNHGIVLTDSGRALAFGRGLWWRGSTNSGGEEDGIPSQGAGGAIQVPSGSEAAAVGDAEPTIATCENCVELLPRLQPASPRPLFVSAAVGDAHTLLLTDAGVLYACGSNARGQCGLNFLLEHCGSGTGRDCVDSPAQVCFPSEQGKNCRLVVIVSIAAAADYSAAVDSEGRAWVWGDAPGAFEPDMLSGPVNVSALIAASEGSGGLSSTAVRFGRVNAAPESVAFLPAPFVLTPAGAEATIAAVLTPSARTNTSCSLESYQSSRTLLAQRCASTASAFNSNLRGPVRCVSFTAPCSRSCIAQGGVPLCIAQGGAALWLGDSTTDEGILHLTRAPLQVLPLDWSCSGAATSPAEALQRVSFADLRATTNGSTCLKLLAAPILSSIRELQTYSHRLDPTVLTTALVCRAAAAATIHSREHAAMGQRAWGVPFALKYTGDAFDQRLPRLLALKRGDTTIGRNGTNDLLWEDNKTSREHAVIKLSDYDTLSITDLNSACGTYLNGVRIAAMVQHPLRVGDALAFGSSVSNISVPVGESSASYRSHSQRHLQAFELTVVHAEDIRGARLGSTDENTDNTRNATTSMDGSAAARKRFPSETQILTASLYPLAVDPLSELLALATVPDPLHQMLALASLCSSAIDLLRLRRSDWRHAAASIGHVLSAAICNDALLAASASPGDLRSVFAAGLVRLSYEIIRDPASALNVLVASNYSINNMELCVAGVSTPLLLQQLHESVAASLYLQVTIPTCASRLLRRGGNIRCAAEALRLLGASAAHGFWGHAIIAKRVAPLWLEVVTHGLAIVNVCGSKRQQQNGLAHTLLILLRALLQHEHTCVFGSAAIEASSFSSAVPAIERLSFGTVAYGYAQYGSAALAILEAFSSLLTFGGTTADDGSLVALARGACAVEEEVAGVALQGCVSPGTSPLATAVIKNRAGASMKPSGNSGIVLYCGRNQSRAAAQGFDGWCGPDRGPQCSDCAAGPFGSVSIQAVDVAAVLRRVQKSVRVLREAQEAVAARVHQSSPTQARSIAMLSKRRVESAHPFPFGADIAFLLPLSTDPHPSTVHFRFDPRCGFVCAEDSFGVWPAEQSTNLLDNSTEALTFIRGPIPGNVGLRVLRSRTLVHPSAAGLVLRLKTAPASINAPAPNRWGVSFDVVEFGVSFADSKELVELEACLATAAVRLLVAPTGRVACEDANYGMRQTWALAPSLVSSGVSTEGGHGTDASGMPALPAALLHHGYLTAPVSEENDEYRHDNDDVVAASVGSSASDTYGYVNPVETTLLSTRDFCLEIITPPKQRQHGPPTTALNVRVWLQGEIEQYSALSDAAGLDVSAAMAVIVAILWHTGTVSAMPAAAVMPCTTAASGQVDPLKFVHDLVEKTVAQLCACASVRPLDNMNIANTARQLLNVRPASNDGGDASIGCFGAGTALPSDDAVIVSPFGQRDTSAAGAHTMNPFFTSLAATYPSRVRSVATGAPTAHPGSTFSIVLRICAFGLVDLHYAEPVLRAAEAVASARAVALETTSVALEDSAAMLLVCGGSASLVGSDNGGFIESALLHLAALLEAVAGATVIPANEDGPWSEPKLRPFDTRRLRGLPLHVVSSIASAKKRLLRASVRFLILCPHSDAEIQGRLGVACMQVWEALADDGDLHIALQAGLVEALRTTIVTTKVARAHHPPSGASTVEVDSTPNPESQQFLVVSLSSDTYSAISIYARRVRYSLLQRLVFSCMRHMSRFTASVATSAVSFDASAPQEVAWRLLEQLMTAITSELFAIAESASTTAEQLHFDCSALLSLVQHVLDAPVADNLRISATNLCQILDGTLLLLSNSSLPTRDAAATLVPILLSVITPMTADAHFDCRTGHRQAGGGLKVAFSLPYTPVFLSVFDALSEEANTALRLLRSPVQSSVPDEHILTADSPPGAGIVASLLLIGSRALSVRVIVRPVSSSSVEPPDGRVGQAPASRAFKGCLRQRSIADTSLVAAAADAANSADHWARGLDHREHDEASVAASAVPGMLQLVKRIAALDGAGGASAVPAYAAAVRWVITAALEGLQRATLAAFRGSGSTSCRESSAELDRIAVSPAVALCAAALFVCSDGPATVVSSLAVPACVQRGASAKATDPASLFLLGAALSAQQQRGTSSAPQLCAAHADITTYASFECKACCTGPSLSIAPRAPVAAATATAVPAASLALCAACDAQLHALPFAAGHARTPLPDPASLAPLAVSNGALRLRVRGVMLSVTHARRAGVLEVDAAELEATAPQEAETAGVAAAAAAAGAAAVAAPIAECRFCSEPLIAAAPVAGGAGEMKVAVAAAAAAAIGPAPVAAAVPARREYAGVCGARACLDAAEHACAATRPCGHACGGARPPGAACSPATCPPCWRGCDAAIGGKGAAAAGAAAAVNGSDYCGACGIDTLASQPSVTLAGCGHTLHYRCLRRQLLERPGSTLTFAFAGCPLCRARPMAHPALDDLTAPYTREEAAVVALLPPLLAEFPHLPRLAPADAPPRERAAAVDAVLGRGLDVYACFTCTRPYFGGLHDCALDAARGAVAWRPEEHACVACVARVTGAECAKHGVAELQWKCRFCCAPAVFFCFGTTHFCALCHDDYDHMQELLRRGLLPACPAGPLGKQLPGTPGEDCPLGVAHPPNGAEHIIGCAACAREAHAAAVAAAAAASAGVGGGGGGAHP